MLNDQGQRFAKTRDLSLCSHDPSRGWHACKKRGQETGDFTMKTAKILFLALGALLGLFAPIKAQSTITEALIEIIPTQPTSIDEVIAKVTLTYSCSRIAFSNLIFQPDSKVFLATVIEEPLICLDLERPPNKTTYTYQLGKLAPGEYTFILDGCISEKGVCQSRSFQLAREEFTISQTSQSQILDFDVNSCQEDIEDCYLFSAVISRLSDDLERRIVFFQWKLTEIGGSEDLGPPWSWEGEGQSVQVRLKKGKTYSIALKGLNEKREPIEMLSGRFSVPTIAQAIDENNDEVIDDLEIINALHLWVKGAEIPKLSHTTIDDATMLGLLTLWIKGPPPPPPGPTLELLVDVDPKVVEVGQVPFIVITVSGTAKGQIKYMVDCATELGIPFNYIVNEWSESYVVASCVYDTPGEYTILVRVIREGVKREVTKKIKVVPLPPPPTLILQARPIPETGELPLEVAILFQLGGTAQGPTSLKINCEFNPEIAIRDQILVWDRQISLPAQVDMDQINNACFYKSPGVHKILIQAERQGVVAHTVIKVRVVRSQLQVALWPEPFVGPAPLNGVDLRVVITGYTNDLGPGQLYFDCKEEPVLDWDLILPVTPEIAAEPIVAPDLCNYLTPDEYHPNVKLVVGQFEAVATAAVLVTGPRLDGTLTLLPSAGKAPLNVTAIVNVSGATGNITYKFDCTSDGVWEAVINSTDSRLQYVCRYDKAGTWTMRVEVSAGGNMVAAEGQILVE